MMQKKHKCGALPFFFFSQSKIDICSGDEVAGYCCYNLNSSAVITHLKVL